MRDKLVAVTWDDPRIDQADPFTRDEIKRREPLRCTTLGLLLRDDDGFIGIANELCADGSFRGVTTVPRALVVGIDVLGHYPKTQRRVSGKRRSGTGGEGVHVEARIDEGSPRESGPVEGRSEV